MTTPTITVDFHGPPQVGWIHRVRVGGVVYETRESTIVIDSPGANSFTMQVASEFIPPPIGEHSTAGAQAMQQKAVAVDPSAQPHREPKLHSTDKAIARGPAPELLGQPENLSPQQKIARIDNEQRHQRWLASQADSAPPPRESRSKRK